MSSIRLGAALKTVWRYRLLISILITVGVFSYEFAALPKANAAATVSSIGSTNSQDGSGNWLITVGAGGVPAGSLIVVAATACANQAETLTTTDTAGNSYSSMTQTIPAGICGLVKAGYIFYAYNSQALVSGNTINVAFSPSFGIGGSEVSAFYATGIQTTSDPLDSGVTVTQTGGFSPQTNPSLTSGAPSVPGELFLGVVSASAYFALGTYSGSWSAPPVFQSNNGANDGSDNSFIAGGTQVNSGTGAMSFSATGVLDPFVAWIIGFKPAPPTISGAGGVSMLIGMGW